MSCGKQAKMQLFCTFKEIIGFVSFLHLLDLRRRFQTKLFLLLKQLGYSEGGRLGDLVRLRTLPDEDVPAGRLDQQQRTSRPELPGAGGHLEEAHLPLPAAGLNNVQSPLGCLLLLSAATVSGKLAVEKAKEDGWFRTLHHTNLKNSFL